MISEERYYKQRTFKETFQIIKHNNTVNKRSDTNFFSDVYHSLITQTNK